MNKKLIKHDIIFLLIGATIFAVTYWLTKTNIISPYDKLLNWIIVGVCDIFCIVYYIIIRDIDIVGTTDCALLTGIYFVIGFGMVSLALSKTGIHFSVCTALLFSNLSLIVNFIGIILQRKDNDRDIDDKRYEEIIRKISFFSPYFLVGGIVLSIVNVIFPISFNL